MESTTYPRVLSDREQREWIAGCPVRVRRVRLSIPGPDDAPVLAVSFVPCGGFSVTSVLAKAALTDARQRPLCDLDVSFAPEKETRGEPSSFPLTVGKTEEALPSKAAYAYVTVREVRYGEGRVWENPSLEKGEVLPDQAVIWQTDPHYEAIRHVCAGVVSAGYYPDAPTEGSWRCACGQVNLAGEGTCGGCGVEKAWLDEHFAPAYLEKETQALQKAASEEKKRGGERKTRKKRREEGLSDFAKFCLILASAVVVVLGIVLAPTVMHAVRYARGERLLEEGSFDEAIALFRELGGFSDAPDRLYEASYKKAQEMTGLEEVRMVESAAYPCYSITEDGVLSFRKDDYGGDWEEVYLPDVVDGVVVRELDKNFFLNCKEMKEVTLPDTLETLGEQTFFNCTALTAIHFGKNVREIGARCFINCTSLTALTVPDTVEKLGLRAFNSCQSLTEVTLGAGITTLSSYLFSDCRSLARVTLLAPVTSIGEYAFSACSSFQELVYPGTAEDWAKVTIGEENDALLSAKIVTQP